MGHWCASLIGCTRSWSVLERLICRTQCRRILQSQGSCWRHGAPPPFLPAVPLCGQRVGAKFCEPKLQNALVQMHGDPLRGCRSSGRRTGSSTLLMKKPSSSTLSRSQARGCSSACGARAEAGGGHDGFESFFDRCADPCVTSVMRHNTPRHGIHSSNTRVPLLCMVGFL